MSKMAYFYGVSKIKTIQKQPFKKIDVTLQYTEFNTPKPNL